MCKPTSLTIVDPRFRLAFQSALHSVSHRGSAIAADAHLIQGSGASCLSVPFFVLLSMSCLCFGDSKYISSRLINDVEACHEAVSRYFIKNRRVLFLEMELTPVREAWNCGCKSALLSYRLSIEHRKKEIFSGSVSSLTKKKLKIDIPSQLAHTVTFNNTFLTLGCANPD